MNTKFMTSCVLLVAAASCVDRTPTVGPSATVASFATTSRPTGDAAALLSNIPISVSNFSGSLSVTHIAYDGAGQLLFSGTVTRASDGLIDHFEDVPGELFRAASNDAPASSSAAPQQSAASSRPCDLLSLAIQPLDLDVLGLTLELSIIGLDVGGVPGPGNSLGNLLCAVVGLLDTAASSVSAIDAQLDRANAILATGS